ncbi:hypothetical protein, partial [Brevibacillus sp. SYSU BS000544]|uniref:hypothetical protein n=1 Tax=Brevibacillus sp. SYSU BS000544 TaxID=3416443 RepID=UPI003CE50D34
ITVAGATTAELEAALTAKDEAGNPVVVAVTQAVEEDNEPILDTYILTLTGAVEGVNYTIELSDGLQAAEGVDLVVSWESVPEPVISITNVSEESELGNVRITVAGTTPAELEAALTAKDEAGNPVVVAVTQAVGEDNEPILDTYILTLTGAVEGVNYTIELSDGLQVAEGVDLVVSWTN